MRQIIVRYQALAAKADTNAALIEAMISELGRAQLDGIRYEVFRHPDNWFTHIFEARDEEAAAAFGSVPAVRAFQESVKDRCAIPPEVSPAQLLGYLNRRGPSR